MKTSRLLLGAAFSLQGLPSFFFSQTWNSQRGGRGRRPTTHLIVTLSLAAGNSCATR